MLVDMVLAWRKGESNSVLSAFLEVVNEIYKNEKEIDQSHQYTDAIPLADK
jgi:hypothetical protein